MIRSTLSKTRREHGRSSAKTALATGVMLAVGATGLLAMSASADRSAPQGGPGKIVGSWQVAVNRPGLPALNSLQTYTRGHGIVETANSGAGARSASIGAWERTGPLTYAATKVFFRYDPATGAYLGTVKLRREIQLAPDGESFTAVSVGELRDPAGNLLPGSNTRRDTEIGQRLNVEPIPE